MRFFGGAETATTGKMTLTPPKRTSAGYYLAMTSPVSAPPLTWTVEGTWTTTSEWNTWASEQRKRLLGELLSHGTWFSKPPRHEVLGPLFTPWTTSMKAPKVPGVEGSTGTATWTLEGIMMTSTEISPIWSIGDYTQDEMQDTISLFGDEEETTTGPQETREIEIEEIDNAPAAAPTHIRSREWEARKFLAKERVREARLKSQIAKSLSRKEESRFYRQFGDLDDAESHFSEYDLTDHEESDSDSGSSYDEDTLAHV